MSTGYIKIPPFYSLPLIKGGLGRDFLVSITIATFFVLPVIGFAQTDYIPLAPLPNTVPEPCNPLKEGAIKPGTEAYKTACKSTGSGLPVYLTGLYKTGIAAAGILAVLMLVWGGFQYMTTEAVSGKSESKGIIINVMWGLATVLASYLLLYIINPRLVDIGLALENLRPVTKTRIPTADETYGAFLDEALKNLQTISIKASKLKQEANEINNKIMKITSNLDNGVYEDEDGNPMSESELQARVNALSNEYSVKKTMEENVRSYEQGVEVVSEKQTNIQNCFKGQGVCGGTSFLNRVGIRTAADLAKDKEDARKTIEGLREFVNKDIQKLQSSGLTEQANDLRIKFKETERVYDFVAQCIDKSSSDKINTLSPAWKKGDACP